MRVVSADWVVPVEGAPFADGAVAIADDGRIAAVGAAADLGVGERFAGCAIVPGFVNAHSHLEYAVYAGFGDGLPFVPWIGVHIRRKEALTLDDMRAIATVGAWDCLRSGITTVGDCSFSGGAAEAAAATGLRAVVFLEVFGRDTSALDRFHELHARVEHATSERVRLGVSPHAPYTCTLEVYEACAGLALPLATHLAESPAERDWLVDGTGDWTPLAGFLVPPPGQTGVRLLAEAGLLGPQVTAAHCVHVDPEEIALLAHHRVGVAHCPRSNGYLGCGTAPVAELLAAGCPCRSPPTAPPRHRPSTSSKSSAPLSSRRAPVHGGRTRFLPPRRSSSRHWAARGCSAWTARWGRWSRGSRRTSRSSRSTRPRSRPLKIPLRRSSWEGRRSGLQLLS